MPSTHTDPLPVRNKNPLLTSVEAAAYIHVRPQTLSVWRCQKTHPELPYIKVGSRVMYRQSHLERFLDSQTVGSRKGK